MCFLQYEDEAQLSLDLHSARSALNLIQNFISSAFEDISSIISSLPSSATSSDDGSSSDTEDSASSLSSSPDSDSTDGQMANSDNTDNAQDEVAGWQLWGCEQLSNKQLHHEHYAKYANGTKCSLLLMVLCY